MLINANKKKRHSMRQVQLEQNHVDEKIPCIWKIWRPTIYEEFEARLRSWEFILLAVAATAGFRPGEGHNSTCMIKLSGEYPEKSTEYRPKEGSMRGGGERGGQVKTLLKCLKE
jgi:hypothetical protein